jgi:hypothetical protein
MFKSKEDDKGGEYSTIEEMRNAFRKPQGKNPLRRSRRRWENITMELKNRA